MITEKITDRVGWTRVPEIARQRLITKGRTVEEEELIRLTKTVGDLLLTPEAFEASCFDSFTTLTLLSYLEKGHEMYRYKSLPEIELSIIQLVNVLEVKHMLSSVLSIFIRDYSRHLCEHLKEEDEFIFPYIKELQKLEERGGVIRPATFLNGWSNLAAFMQSHSDTEKDLRILETVLAPFKQDGNAGMLVRRLINQIAILEADLHIHALIEDEVIIPRALQAEKILLS